MFISGLLIGRSPDDLYLFLWTNSIDSTHIISLRRKKGAMLEAVRDEYIRRGKPLEYTGWEMPEVRQFMMAHLRRSKPGDDVGASRRLLPKRPSPDEPAPMPQWVLDQGEDVDCGDSRSEGSEEDDDIDLTDEGWSVKKRRGGGIPLVPHSYRFFHRHRTPRRHRMETHSR